MTCLNMTKYITVQMETSVLL